jgi:hypothetical protein
MEARCPRCSTVFTTDRSGIQFCPNCGQQVDVPDPYERPPGAQTWGQPPGGASGGGGGFGAGRFPGEPPAGGGPFPGPREPTPWERRSELGLVHGFFETWKRSIFSPQTFFPSVRPEAPWTEALFYAWIVHAIAVALGFPFVALGVAGSSMPRGFGGDPQMENAMRTLSGAMGVGPLIASLVLYPLLLLAGAAIIHLAAMLFGAASNGYGATVRALCYSAGPNVLGVIPCLSFVAWVYSVVLAIFGISSLQQTSLGKAAAIVLLPFALLLCCCAAAFALGLASMIGLAGAGSRSL